MAAIFRRFRLFLAITGAVALVALYVVYSVFYGPNEFEGTTEKTFFVSRGQSFSSIVDSLEAGGVIRNRELFVFVAKIFGGTNRIQVGKYVFASGISNVELFLSLREGRKISLVTVTIPEGLRPRSEARILRRTLGIDSARFVQLVHNESFVQSLGIDAKTFEGYLLPETYSFPWQPDERDVIERLVGEFQRFYTDSLKARARELGWSTSNLLAMASIVEGETILDEERPIVAGVYHNRLRKGMRLEADPTIQFIIENGPRRILYSDLTLDHPYNTYRNRGLPPGPINNPGKASILAALYPAKHNYLYFVANGQRGHWFASTYDEHLRNVRRFRHARAQNQAGSATPSGTPQGISSSK